MNQQMDEYEKLSVLGEGTYGTVIKSMHRPTGTIVAVKRIRELQESVNKKAAVREIQVLKAIQHSNIVKLLEVIKGKQRVFLVLEFVDKTLLKIMERNPAGLGNDMSRRYFWQILKGVEHLHSHSIILRDIKPENVLVSDSGLVKLCDFGMAKMIDDSALTQYVSTRWYRAPELLVGSDDYSFEVDVWALGCLLPEMITSQPVFPGVSDLDQIRLIIKIIGPFPDELIKRFRKNPSFTQFTFPQNLNTGRENAWLQYQHDHPMIKPTAFDLISWCLRLDSRQRPTVRQMMNMPFFTIGKWKNRYEQELDMLLSTDTLHRLALDKVSKYRALKQEPMHSPSTSSRPFLGWFKPSA